MKKSEAIQLAGNSVKLARLLGISKQAVSDWGDDVPYLRVCQLQVLKPEWFGLPTTKRRRTPKQ